MDFHEAVRIILKWYAENQSRLSPSVPPEVHEAFEIADAYMQAGDALDPALEAAQKLNEMIDKARGTK